MLVVVTDEARNAPRTPASAPSGPTANGTGERVVPRFTPPEPPIPTRFYVGKGATLESPPPSED